MGDQKHRNPGTIAEFEERLLDGDRWIELVAGRFSRLQPPDDVHGDVVLNLARAFATVLKKSTDIYACFELPLVIEHDPPTVRTPAVSCFRHVESRFAEVDKVLTETCPLLVIEVASTNDRRESIKARIDGYLRRGVEGVWVIDPVTRHVHQFLGRGSQQMLKENQVLTGYPLIPGLAMPVSDLFRSPNWTKTLDPIGE